MASLDDITQLKARVTSIEESNWKRQADLDSLATNLNSAATKFQRMTETLDAAKIEWASKFDTLNGGVVHDRKVIQDCVGQITDLTNKASALIEDVGKLKIAAQHTPRTSPSGTSSTPDLVGLKSLSGVTVYSGEAGKYNNWACKLRSAVSGKYPEMKILLKWIGDRRMEPNDLELDAFIQEKHLDEEDTRDLLDQLYCVLIAKTDGSALHLIQGYEDGDHCSRGVKSWWKLKQMAQGMTGERLVGLSERIINPPRCAKTQDLQAAVDLWESWVREVECAEGSIQECLKITGLTKLLPDHLATYVQAHGFDCYSDLKRYVDRQISQHRENWFGGTQSPGTTSKGVGGRTAMDIGAVQQAAEALAAAAQQQQPTEGYRVHWDDALEEGDIDADKEKAMAIGGKGRQFQGNCYSCGKKGHRAHECRSNPYGKGGKNQESWGSTWGNQQGQWGSYQSGNWNQSKGKGKEQQSWKGDSKGYGKSHGKGKGPWQAKGGYAGALEHGFSAAWTTPPTMCSLTTSPPCGVVRERLDPAYVPMPEKPAMWWKSNPFGILAQDSMEVSDEDSDVPSAEVLGQTWTSLSECSKSAKNKKERLAFPRRRAKKWIPLPAEDSLSSPEDALTADPVVSGTLGGRVDSASRSTCEPVGMLGALTVAPPSPRSCSGNVNYLGEDVVSMGSMSTEWECMESYMDSGASASVMPASVGKGVPLEESEGSRKGLVYYAANGDKLPNRGKKTLSIVTEEWSDYLMTYQVTDVVKPLTSVSSICDAAGGLNSVTFTSTGGWIYHGAEDRYTGFQREKGMYVLRT